MISPRVGVVFSLAPEGDLLGDQAARRSFRVQLGLPSDWATIRQVHGHAVVEATGPGPQGEADAIFTRVRHLPLAVFTADCVGVVLVGSSAVGVAHAGWRGAAAGVVTHLAEAMAEAGSPPEYAAIGPGIGPCCFEVGQEVATAFPGRTSRTTWDTLSVDLWGAVADQVPGLEVWRSDHCTFDQDDTFSHRRQQTERRMATIGWRP
jgi:YfiH family protein